MHIPTTTKLTIDNAGEAVEQTLSRSIIETLLYLIARRPGISYVLGVCARF